MRTKLLTTIAAALALTVLAAPAAAAPRWPIPHRDHGHGRWFERACDQAPRSFAACGAQVVSNDKGVPLASGSPPSTAYGPAQFVGGYNLPANPTSTKTIGIVDAYDDPNAESDLAAYSSYYGLRPCTTANGCFRKVNQNGGTSYPRRNSGWALEISLDVQVAHAVCPSCNILLVEASSNSFANLGAAENRAVALGADVVSNSWGGNEFSSETSYDSYFNHPGVVITASTGDAGYGVEYPAASRYVVGVGGTTLALNPDNSYRSESAWVDAGSGCSAYVGKPAWQHDGGCGNRAVADVSADADPNTGAAVYDSYGYGGWLQVGGTSLASPLIAAVFALSGNTSDGTAPYGNASALHDVTSGSNGSCGGSYLCTAGPGYDGPTGLGTPNGLGAFSGIAPQPDFSLSASSGQTVNAGDSATYTISLTPSNGYGGSPSLSVTSALPSGANWSFDPGSVSAGTPSTLTLSTSSSTPGGTYSLTVQATDGSLTHTTTVSLTVQAPDFSLSASSGQTVNAGASADYTISLTPSNGYNGSAALSVTSGLPSGVSTQFSPGSVSAGTPSTLTVSTSSSTPTGTYSLTVQGTDGSLQHTTTVSLTVQKPDFSLSASSAQTVNPGDSAGYTVSATGSGGYNGSAALSVTSGLPSGVSAQFNPDSIGAGGSSTLTLTTSSSTPDGTYPLTVQGADGALTHTTTVTLTVQTAPAGDFSIGISPSSRFLGSSSSTTYTVTITSSNGFSGPVALTVSGLPSNVSGSFGPSTVNGSGSSTLTLTSSHAGFSRVTITVTGTSGSLSHSASASLFVW